MAPGGLSPPNSPYEINGMEFCWGTPQAAAIVAALITMIQSTRNFSPSQMKSHLISRARPLLESETRMLCYDVEDLEQF